MVETVGVKFKSSGKMYSFSPGDLKCEVGDKVIVETTHGIEHGEVVVPNRMQDRKEMKFELKPIIRLATDEDIKIIKTNEAKRIDAIKICQEKIDKHDLDMKLIDAEYTFDGKKVLFYFTSDGRVDFRDLVKELAAIFHIRIELRQIGVRDEAKMIGGIGICGRELCCKTFLSDFEPVSIKMAKEQDLSLNPTKISGCCGRLMCCLNYEQHVYSELIKITPPVGTFVMIGKDRGKVIDVNILTGMLTVSLDKSKDGVPVVINKTEVKVLKQR